MRIPVAALAVALALPIAAVAQDAGFEVVAHQLTSAVADKQPVDEKATFAVGDRAYLWMNLTPNGEPTMRVRWSVDGAQVWTSEPKTVYVGRTWVYKTVHVGGAWTAEVLDDADTVLASAAFTATGEAVPAAVSAPAPTATATPTPAPVTAAPEPEPEPEPILKGALVTERTAPGTIAFTSEPAPPSPAAAAPADPPPEGAGDVSVIEFQLATAVEEREPVSPGTSFAVGDRVYAWARLSVTADSDVRARWRRGGELVSIGDPMAVQPSSGWRTWMSTEAIEAGDWQVELLDPDDRVLHSAEFSVR